MGVMQKLRQGMPIVVIGLIILFILLIIFEWGDARRGHGTVRTTSSVVGEVNGYEISEQEYNDRIELAKQSQRQYAMMGQSIDDERTREMAWQDLVQEKIVERAADKLGLTISDEEVNEEMRYNPPAEQKQLFSDSAGGFQQETYFEYLNNPQDFLGKLVSQQRIQPQFADTIFQQLIWSEQRARRKMSEELVAAVVTSSALPSPLEAMEMFREANTHAKGSVATIDFSRIADSAAKATEQEARTYYESHKEEFVARPSREVKYVTYTLQPTAEDSNAVFARLKRVTEALGQAKTEQESDKIFGDFVAQIRNGIYDGVRFTSLKDLPDELRTALADAKQYQIIGPIQLAQGNSLIEVMEISDGGDPSVRASHILLKTTGKNDDSVKALADKVAARVRSGEGFEQLAQQYSSDGSAQSGGDLGYFTRGKMVKEFEEASFAAKPGEIVGPVKTQFGWHIIKVTDRITRSYKLRDIRFDVKVSTITKNLVRQRARQLHDSLAGGGSIDSIGARMKLQVLSTGPIDPMGGQSGNARLAAFAMSARKGAVSDVIESQDGTLLVGQLVEVTEGGVQPFEKVKDNIMNYLATKRKLDLIKPAALALRSKLAAGDSLESLRNYDSTVRITPVPDVTMSGNVPGIGTDAAVMSALFSAKPGEITQPVRGDRGYYIIQLDSLTLPADTAFASGREKFVKDLYDKRKKQVWENWLKHERDIAEIKDFRYTPQ